MTESASGDERAEGIRTLDLMVHLAHKESVGGCRLKCCGTAGYASYSCGQTRGVPTPQMWSLR
jgi:hypothetical protein